MDWWIRLLHRTAIVVGATSGLVFCDEDVYVWDSVTINEMLLEALESIYTMKKDLFPFGVQTAEDVRLKYGIYQSF